MDTIRNFVQERKTLLSFLMLITILIYAKNVAPQGLVKQATNERTSNTESLTEQPSATPTVPTQTPTLSPTKMPTPTPIQSGPTSAPKSILNILDFFYPGATQVSSTSDTLTLESLDEPDTITQWYKNKINSLGMSAKSFVVAKTNGNVLNKLVADNGEREIRVEITKSKKQDKTEIVVTIHSS